MLRIALSDTEREELLILKKTHAKASIRLKAEVVLLKDMNYSQTEIAKIAFIQGRTVQSHLKLFLKGGISQLIEDKSYRPKSKLEPDKEKIKAFFEKNPAFSVNHAIEEIEKISGHRMSPTRTRLFMKKIGLKFLKTGSIPAKQADEKKQIEQEEFKKKLIS
jgi:transposase